MLLGETGEGVERREWKLWRGAGGRHTGTQIQSVSLATIAATPSFGVASLSLAAAPVSGASLSGTSDKAGGLDQSFEPLHLSVHPATTMSSHLKY